MIGFVQFQQYLKGGMAFWQKEIRNWNWFWDNLRTGSLIDINSGDLAASSVYQYPHGVITEKLPVGDLILNLIGRFSIQMIILMA